MSGSEVTQQESDLVRCAGKCRPGQPLDELGVKALECLERVDVVLPIAQEPGGGLNLAPPESQFRLVDLEGEGAEPGTDRHLLGPENDIRQVEAHRQRGQRLQRTVVPTEQPVIFLLRGILETHPLETMPGLERQQIGAGRIGGLGLEMAQR